jgi:tRNA(Ile)-lysidine synthase
VRPSLVTVVRRALEGECALPRNAQVVVAVSGGPDSMALLSVMARLAPKFGLGLSAHGIDHGLRPDAAAELDVAAEFAAKLGVPFARTKVDVNRGGNLQARARDARWQALLAASNDAVIATAHHAEDRAETVLLRILRGSGARGLAVLPPQSVKSGVSVVRPLLRAERSDVMAHLERHKVPFATDPSNTDPRYTRTRVRSELMPLLRALDPAIVSHLSAIADDLATKTAQPVDSPGWTSGLPRATQTALAELVHSRSKEARVWLPDGLVAMNAADRPRKP